MTVVVRRRFEPRDAVRLPPPSGVAIAFADWLSRRAREILIEREPRRPVTAVEWEKVVHQITGDYRCSYSNEIATWTALGEPDQFLRDIAPKPPTRCVLTGSSSSNHTVIATAPYTAIVYTDDPDRLAKDFRLHPARTNANVITAVPYGPIVYERIRTIDGLEHASIAQVLIDCLTGTAGTPSEGEALLKWMRQNEPQRRSSALLGKAGSR